MGGRHAMCVAVVMARVALVLCFVLLGACGGSGAVVDQDSGVGTDGGGKDGGGSATCAVCTVDDPYYCQYQDLPDAGPCPGWCTSEPLVGWYTCHLDVACESDPPASCPASAPFLCAYSASTSGPPCLWKCVDHDIVDTPTIQCTDTLDGGAEAGDAGGD
jgi:hypothetical protein